MTELLVADDSAIDRAAELIRAGRLVALPTETVYGLGANATDADAVRRIFTAKGRPATNPLIVHVADTADARRWVTAWPGSAARLAAQFWPGPLTLVLPKSAVIPDVVTAGGPTVAVRVPDHPVMLAVLRRAGVPIAAPSANPSEAVSPTTAAHVLAAMAGRVDLILDGGPTTRGIESTVLDLTTQPPRVLRPGPIGRAELEVVIGLIGEGGNETKLARSPGQMRKHYSPRARLELVEGDPAGRVAELRQMGIHAERLEGSDDPEVYAAELYARLHQLDDAGAEVIVATWPPDRPEWAAVRDRLRRAAG